MYLSQKLHPTHSIFSYGRSGYTSPANSSLSNADIIDTLIKSSENILVYSISTETPGLDSFTSSRSICQELSTLSSILRDIHGSVRLSFVYLVSSAGAFAYQAGKSGPHHISEDSCEELSSGYALTTKLKEDMLTEFCRSYSIPNSILRLSNLFGPPFILERSQGLINKLLLSSAFNSEVTIRVPLETRKNFLFIDDFCEILYRLIKLHLDRHTIPRLLLVCSSEHISIREVVDVINCCLDSFCLGRPVVTYSLSEPHSTQPDPVLYNSLIASTLKEFSFTPFSASVRICVYRLLQLNQFNIRS